MSGNIKFFKELNDLLIKNETEFFKFLINCNNYKAYEISMIIKAYYLAKEAHKDQKRKSGEEYIVHPMNVAKILIMFGFDYETVVAGLLHDVVEDTDVTLNEISILFGTTIASLVDGVTKMKDKDFSNREESVIATHKKLLENILVDARIIVIKLVDRLHNMITMDSMSRAKQIEKSTENMDFGVPLARALGMYIIKDELQDLSLYYLYPEDYEILFNERKNIKEKYYPIFGQLAVDIGYKLEKEGIHAKFSPKIKNVGGIYEEIISGKELDNINDLAAMRIVLDDNDECMEILGYIKEIASFIDGTYKDYITKPKYNGYRSLNQNIIYSDMNIQLRIRNEKDEAPNLMGVAANWNLESQEVVRNMCHSLIDMENKNLSNREFMEEAKRYFLKRRGQD